MVPLEIVERLWNSQFAEEEAGQIVVEDTLEREEVLVAQTRSRLQIREWTNILLGRSLLLGSLHTGIKIHGKCANVDERDSRVGEGRIGQQSRRRLRALYKKGGLKDIGPTRCKHPRERPALDTNE